MKTFRNALKLGAACVMAAGAMVVLGGVSPAQAAVTVCPPQTRPVYELISVSPYEGHSYTGTTLTGETSTTCTYRGTLTIETQGGANDTLYNVSRTFRKSKMNNDGSVNP